MSSPLAIAAVTAVLKDLLNEGLINHDVSSGVGGNIKVTASPPDLIKTEPSGTSQLNLYLYHVTPNAGWRNVGLPARDAGGTRLTNPPLALDLHYLLTAYGAEDFHAEILLGYAMQLLHETPVLTRNAIRESLKPPSPVSGSILPPALQTVSAADLADQVEQIKICPLVLSTEEMSKLWTAFQAKYRPTAAYQISVVLIESRHSTKTALPVRRRNVTVFTLRQPVIEQVVSQSGEGEWIYDSSALVIRGHQLRGNITTVRIGENETPAPGEVAETQIVVPVPSDAPAGVQGVQVIHRLDLGTPSPSEPHRGCESNVAAFVLHPTIARPAPTPPATTPREVPPPFVTNPTPTLENGQPVVVDGITLFSATITVNFAPRVGKKQRVILLLNQVNLPEGKTARAYSFNAPHDNGITDPDQANTASIGFPVNHIAPDHYLVRVQVDGAESALSIDPNTGRYQSPQVTI